MSFRLTSLSQKHLLQWNFFILFDIILMIQNYGYIKDDGPGHYNSFFKPVQPGGE